MRILAITFMLLMWLNVLPHVVSSLNERPRCSGGSSLLGLDEWNSKSLRCCDSSGSCHGYDVDSVATEVADSLQNLLNATLPIQRSRFKRNFGDSQSRPDYLQDVPKTRSIQLEESSNFADFNSTHVDETASPLCSSKVSVFYPITGFSATSRKRVAIIQISPFKQPVVYDQCLERSSRILRGNCVQVYSPQPLYILTAADEGDKYAAKLDFVLVEAGCRCQTRPLGDASSSSSSLSSAMGVDATVREALRIITGSDFDEDYFAMLAAIDAASAIAGLNQPATATRPVYSSASAATAAPSTAPTTAPVIDPWWMQGLGRRTTTATPPLLPPSSVQTEMITSPSDESSHDLASDNEITSSSTAVTVLPLPELPDHGQPLLIPSGHFNPVLLSIQKFLNLP